MTGNRGLQAQPQNLLRNLNTGAAEQAAFLGRLSLCVSLLTMPRVFRTEIDSVCHTASALLGGWVCVCVYFYLIF